MTLRPECSFHTPQRLMTLGLLRMPSRGHGPPVYRRTSISTITPPNGSVQRTRVSAWTTGRILFNVIRQKEITGYVFAIWGLIYIAMIGYAVAQFLQPLATDPLPDALAWPLIVSNVANVVWLLLWQSLNIYWTVPVMLVLLGSLIVAYRISLRDRPAKPSAMERWAVRAPLGLYLGWVSVATIANISAALYAANWSGWGIPAAWWGVVVLAVGATLAFVGQVRDGDGVFAGVFVWAFAGIAVATSSSLVRLVAGALAAAIAVGIVASVLARRRSAS